MTTLHQSGVDMGAGNAACADSGSGDHCIPIVVGEGSSYPGNENLAQEEKNVPSSISGTGTEIVGVQDTGRESSVSDCSVVVDLEAGAQETKVHLSKTERDCRICHLSLDVANQESNVPIELGCSCKDDLAAAHKHCAEAWFKIKGNKTCEICGSIARNVVGINDSEFLDNEGSETSIVAAAPIPVSESRNFWQGHRFLNFLLACMVFAFVISWLFHFNIPS
ncbi:OLC1v1026695C1 [Oldenlandia corymbosa var. corymbosa]|uniref:OLC1v1026695C1 n=1 Tax=Oldenlandia corymbosa var. corymbosa TaxID=529605 RepID=A0AAV1CAZ9_OLDCO|nr:OLC1v1026695C1 [Oldenlandia corymbosa var. corymbosa]